MDEAQRAHNCQGNSKHRIERGDKRLKVRKERSWDHYCLECAAVILRRDLETLKDMVSKMDIFACVNDAKD